MTSTRACETGEASEQVDAEASANGGNGFGRQNRMRRYLESKQKDVEANRSTVRMAAELLTNHLQLLVAGSPGSVARKRSLARGIARQFDRSVREARHRYRELCEAQADLEAARGGVNEIKALAARNAAEARFLDAFSEVISLPVEE
ncbi:MAG: hypothetical protein ACO1SX_11355 [Actinomycetota bacterium]